MKTDYKTAHAVARDAANNQAKVNRRSSWNMEDYNLACRTLARLFPGSGANEEAGLANDPYSVKRLANLQNTCKPLTS